MRRGCKLENQAKEQVAVVRNRESLKIWWGRGWTHIQMGCEDRLAVSRAPAAFPSFWGPSDPRALAVVLGWAVGSRGRSQLVTAFAKLLRSLLPTLLPRGL